ncbi:MAG: Hsp20/alpha crystallin family protein [Elusimicrobiales bacterium]|nr:Hsp20/alpha crystallin family protein [Elusimicrobiales bacterium]
MKHELFPIKKTNELINQWFEDIFEPQLPSLGILKDEYPKIDMKETSKEIIITAEIPGVDKKDIKLEVNDNLLTISFEKKQEKDEKDKNGWRIIERSYGKFSRTISLPQPVKEGSAKANYKDGVLKIILPKQKETKISEIKID